VIEAGSSENAQAPSVGRAHVLGAGPVGLMVTALLQPLDGLSVHLYEKRREYTRTRMVQLAPYLVADSLEAYRADHHDGDNVEAVFEAGELTESLAYRQSMPSDLMDRFARGPRVSARSTRSSVRSAT
jgi:2-polyprenyl-6-methoxyphenol hydroxylase-like FAD-dependent oxidoreductase